MLKIFIDFLKFIFSLFVFTPRARGARGEERVSSYLMHLPYEDYVVLDDIMLKTGNSTSQIDHIVVSIHGVFIIETKNYKGWILGGENSEYWTQSFYKKKYQFRNPIKQNKSHERALKPLLKEYPNARLFPIVAFSPRCELKIYNTSASVVYFHEVRALIKRIKTECLTHAEMFSLAQLIRNSNITSDEKREEHTQAVRQKVYKANQNIQQGICPYCGKNLVQRTSKYGKFYGCTGYPKCKYILR